MGRVLMGYWDCPYCDKKEIPGSQAKCPGCGRPRGDVRFYMKGHRENEVRREGEQWELEALSEEDAKYVSKNPDWYCSYCDTLNSDNASSCAGCGASRADSEQNYFDRKRRLEEKEQEQAQILAAHTASQKPKRPFAKPLLILVIAVIALAGLFIYLGGDSTRSGLTVSSVSWERAIAIEEYRMYQESGWSLPQGAELTDTRSEIHHYDSVLDHYENVEVQRSRRVLDHYETYYRYQDRGNGYFEEVPYQEPVYTTEYYTETERQPVYRQVPRYQDKYYYNIWRWTESRAATASGDDQNPYWPDPQLTDGERTGRTGEAYRFTVTDENGQTARYRVNEEAWRNLRVNEPITITSKRTGSDPHIAGPNGERIADLVREQ